MSCNHPMCDLCGRKRCEQGVDLLKMFGPIRACDFCVKKAVRFAYDASCKWSAVIDKNRPCGYAPAPATLPDKEKET